MPEPRTIRVERVHPHAWLWEPLETEATFVLRAMFGTKAVYLDGKLMLCFATKLEPWSGVLVATDRPHQASLIAEIPGLVPHPVLPKWLYLSESAEAFESKAEQVVRLVRRRDARLGVVPSPKKRKRVQPLSPAAAPRGRAKHPPSNQVRP
jgi:hypothetical protein